MDFVNSIIHTHWVQFNEGERNPCLSTAFLECYLSWLAVAVSCWSLLIGVAEGQWDSRAVRQQSSEMAGQWDGRAVRQQGSETAGQWDGRAMRRQNSSASVCTILKHFCQTILCCLLCTCCLEGAFPDLTCLLHSGVSRPLSMATAFCSCISVSWRSRTSLPVLYLGLFITRSSDTIGWR